MHKDLIRLDHMLDSATAALSFIKERTRKDLDTDRQLLSAITRELEILGEAANNISKKTQSLFPQIPWKNVINMRNRLIHAYFDVNKGIVWTTLEILPDFCQTLEKAIQILQTENNC